MYVSRIIAITLAYLSAVGVEWVAHILTLWVVIGTILMFFVMIETHGDASDNPEKREAQEMLSKKSFSWAWWALCIIYFAAMGWWVITVVECIACVCTYLAREFARDEIGYLDRG